MLEKLSCSHTEGHRLMQTFKERGNMKQCCLCPRGAQIQSSMVNVQMDFLPYQVENTFTWDSQEFSAW